MASCAPPKSAQNEMNELLRAQPLPRACPTPTPLSTAATQTEWTMDTIAKLETIKLKVDERRLKYNELQQKKRKKRKLWQLMIANANPEQAARKVAASAAALAAPTPPPPPLPLPAPAEDASVEPQTVEIEDRHDPALNPPQESRVGRKVGENKSIYLSRKDFHTYGYTDGCRGCRDIARGLLRRLHGGLSPHNVACRNEMETAIKFADPHRWARYLFRRGQEEVAEARRRRQRAVRRNPQFRLR